VERILARSILPITACSRLLKSWADTARELPHDLHPLHPARADPRRGGARPSHSDSFSLLRPGSRVRSTTRFFQGRGEAADRGAGLPMAPATRSPRPGRSGSPAPIRRPHRRRQVDRPSIGAGDAAGDATRIRMLNPIRPMPIATASRATGGQPCRSFARNGDGNIQPEWATGCKPPRCETLRAIRFRKAFGRRA